jgi:hypothetical protein
MSRSRLIGAPQVVVFINGQPFGKCTSFQWTSLTPHVEEETVDVMFPVELKPVRTKVAFQMGVLRLIADGGMQAAGLVPQQQHLSRERYFTVQLIERKTGTTLFSSTMNVVDSESWSVRPKGLLEGTVVCKGVTWVNEAGDATPSGA